MIGPLTVIGLVGIWTGVMLLLRRGARPRIQLQQPARTLTPGELYQVLRRTEQPSGTDDRKKS